MPSSKKRSRSAESVQPPSEEMLSRTEDLQEQEYAGVVETGDVSAASREEIGALPGRRIPYLVRASGRYEWSLRMIPRPRPIPIRPSPISRPERPTVSEVEDGDLGPLTELEEVQEVGEVEEADRAGMIPFWFHREELRLDVDGRYPQNVASGTIYSGPTMRIHWIANLRRVRRDVYTGPIWYKDGNARWLPYTRVTISVRRSWFSNQRKATARFHGRGVPTRTRTFRWKSAAYRDVNFEFDTVQGTNAVTRIDLGDHPNRPSSLPQGTMSLETVYRRAGFDVSVSPGAPIPLSGSGANQRWSDAEMHDAMQVYWSRFANRAQWDLWVLFAALHERGTSLGGIMFDDIGPQHRQGTAIFNDSFISNPPAGDPAPGAWVRRMKFWTAAHEMGHAFNLAHSWQKALIHQGNGPWIPLANEPEARSFMNYPYNVSGGQQAFFSDFEFRFSDSELLFMRHAPERFVEMGNAEWFDHHGFEQAMDGAGSPYRLELRYHREEDYFEFLEPVVLELKLGNVSTDPVIVPENLLESSALTVIVKKRGETAKTWHPFAEYCMNGGRSVLMPSAEPGSLGEALYAPLRLTGGVGGWPISEPGFYTVQVATRIGDRDIVSNPLEVRVAPPMDPREEFLAQDFFSEDVGRVLTFAGSTHLSEANKVLEKIAEELDDRSVARHARVALAIPETTAFKRLQIDEDEIQEVQGGARPALEFVASKVDADSARSRLEEALLDRPHEAADTLGHIGYEQCIRQYGEFLAEHVEPADAASSLEQARETLKERGVIEPVLKQMRDQAKAYEKKTKKK